MATAMAATAAERAVLEEEFRWLLHDEVHAVLRQLQDILKEASLRFTLPGSGSEGPTKQENFILSSCGTDQVKGVLTLQGDALSQADVNLKVPRNSQLLHFAFREDKQWKLQQIQDARNHVSQAIYLLTSRDESYQFRTGAEVLKLMDAVMLQLTRARNRLTTPAALTLPEIAMSGLTRMFAPALPSDLLVNVYINLNKLCLTVYQLHTLQPSSTKNFRPAGGAVLHSPGAMFEWGPQRLEVSHVHKVECVIPWLNDALVFFTVSLQLCQQLKDKVRHSGAAGLGRTLRQMGPAEPPAFWGHSKGPPHTPGRGVTVSLGNSTLSLTHCPWMTLNLGHRVQQGPDLLATIHHVSPPPSLPDLCVLQLLELQTFLSKHPRACLPGSGPSPGVPCAPHTHPLECWPELGNVGYLFPSLPHPTCYIYTDESEH